MLLLNSHNVDNVSTVENPKYSGRMLCSWKLFASKNSQASANTKITDSKPLLQTNTFSPCPRQSQCLLRVRPHNQAPSSPSSPASTSSTSKTHAQGGYTHSLTLPPSLLIHVYMFIYSHTYTHTRCASYLPQVNASEAAAQRNHLRGQCVSPTKAYRPPDRRHG
jgi:hypothetical protein